MGKHSEEPREHVNLLETLYKYNTRKLIIYLRTDSVDCDVQF